MKTQTQTTKTTLPNLGKVEIRQITFGDVLSLKNLDEDQQMIKIVEKALVSPKMTERDIINLPMKAFQDLATIVEIATGAEVESD